ncbi:hypothetical protein GJ698_00890 [Pseudoduganella sp. FT26W]|uniref:Transporter substrate-binding domain-containing protein n=1 Tax=Duganella aquatilis TaxID=2666082 RepID=A0A844CYT8_9BURK|nr:transporter substrate-binding domain-containing protein [Duganella aquatilis]MRW82645.1 hypothetical protein [Duganella aquatilis]
MNPSRVRRQLLRLGLAVIPSLAGAATSKPLRMTVVDIMPWSGLDATGQPCGAIVDLVRRLSQSSGIRIDITVVPYGRAARMLIENDADLMVAVNGAHGTILPPPIAELGQEDIVLLGAPGSRYARMADLRQKTVGYLRGATFVPAFADDPAIRKYAFDSYQQGIRMLSIHRFDALIGSGRTIDYTLRHLGMTTQDMAKPFLVSHNAIVLYISSGAQTPGLLARLKTACHHLRRQRALEACLRHYLP